MLGRQKQDKLILQLCIIIYILTSITGFYLNYVNNNLTAFFDKILHFSSGICASLLAVILFLNKNLLNF